MEMEEINNSETYTNKKNNDSVENEILKYIRASRYGLNITQIAKELSMSRNTVKANVESLQKKGSIIIKQIGKSRICYYRKYFDRNQIFRPFLLQFFNQLLDSFEQTLKSQVDNSEELVKQISINFGQKQDLPPFQLLNLDEIDLKDITLKKVVETFLQMFVGFFEVLSIQFQAENIPADANSTSRIVRLQVFSDEIGKSILFYHMVAGYFESKLNIAYKKKISLDVIEFREESSICYFRLKMEN